MADLKTVPMELTDTGIKVLFKDSYLYPDKKGHGNFRFENGHNVPFNDWTEGMIIFGEIMREANRRYRRGSAEGTPADGA